MRKIAFRVTAYLLFIFIAFIAGTICRDHNLEGTLLFFGTIAAAILVSPHIISNE
jgi:hypothetical protein